MVKVEKSRKISGEKSPKKNQKNSPLKKDVKSPTKKQPKITDVLSPKNKSPKKNGNSPQEKSKKSRNEGPIAYSKASIKTIIQRANPEMQIGSTVPSMIGTAALQFTAYLAQTSLEASIRRRKNKEGKVEFSVDYADVAQSVQGDPRLEALHSNVPRQITAQAALLKRSELFAKQAELI